jgi:hypothetical protein
LSIKPRTIADPSVDISKKAIEGMQQKQEAESLIVDSPLAKSAAIPVYTEPVYDEMTILLNQNRAGTVYSEFTPPTAATPEARIDLFRRELIPSIGDSDKLEAIVQIISSYNGNEKDEKEKKILLQALKTTEEFQHDLVHITNKRDQIQKG